MSTNLVNRAIIPTHAMVGLFDESDLLRLISYGITLDIIISQLLLSRCKTPIEAVLANDTNIPIYIDWDIIMRLYTHHAQISPMRLDYQAVCQIYYRVFMNMYVCLEEILFALSAPYRNLNEIFFKVTNTAVISDGFYFEYIVDYIPF